MEKKIVNLALILLIVSTSRIIYPNCPALRLFQFISRNKKKITAPILLTVGAVTWGAQSTFKKSII